MHRSQWIEYLFVVLVGAPPFLLAYRFVTAIMQNASDGEKYVVGSIAGFALAWIAVNRAMADTYEQIEHTQTDDSNETNGS